jgi:hypothetical protein
MSSIFKPILPIPEDVIVGSGSYVIPANKYAFFQAFATVSGSKNQQSGTSTDNGTSMLPFAAANNCTQWLVAGDSITVSTTYTNRAGSTTWGNTSTGATPIIATIVSSVLLNATVICQALASVYAGNGSSTTAATFCQVGSTGGVGWSAALFPIPKNNLPTQLIEGN